MSRIKNWRLQHDGVNIRRYVNTVVRTFPVEIANAEFNQASGLPRTGWTVFYRRNSSQTFNTKENAIKWAVRWMEAHPHG